VSWGPNVAPHFSRLSFDVFTLVGYWLIESGQLNILVEHDQKLRVFLHNITAHDILILLHRGHHIQWLIVIHNEVDLEFGILPAIVFHNLT